MADRGMYLCTLYGNLGMLLILTMEITRYQGVFGGADLSIGIVSLNSNGLNQSLRTRRMAVIDTYAGAV